MNEKLEISIDVIAHATEDIEKIINSFENDLHSGPDSSTLSVITNPHLPQKFSPVFASVTIFP